MAKVNKIYIVGEISDEAYLEFAKSMDKFEALRGDLQIELTSLGGVTTSALAFASRIRESKKSITVIARGSVESAAVIILAYCHRRKMDKDAWVMVHEDRGSIKGDVVSMERQAAHARRMEEQWVALICDSSRATQQEWERLHKKETYLSASECLALGLIDEII